jgi:hypothetical protein
MLGSSWVAAQLAASQEGLNSVSKLLTEVLLSYCCGDRHDREFHCWMGKKVPSHSHRILQPAISFKIVPIIRHFPSHSCNHTLAGTLSNDSSSLPKRFRTHVYIKSFHCFGPQNSPSSFLNLFLEHSIYAHRDASAICWRIVELLLYVCLVLQKSLDAGNWWK